MAADKISNQLKVENAKLHAKVKGLEYENKMYKQLLDNLFLNQRSGNCKNETVFQQSNILRTNIPVEKTTEIGTEIFNGYDEEDEEEYFDKDYFEEKNQRKKMAKELKDEEIMPIVEDQELKMTEMVKLYGETEAKEILAMETAMEMRFQKLKDVKFAQLWPCLPLNMKFA
jgi:hypothetical protein